MKWVLIRHQVADYEKWKPHFDGHEPERKAAGIQKGYLLRSIDDPNEVVIALQAEDAEKARQVTQSADLREVIKRAGVVDEPTIRILEVVEELGG